MELKDREHVERVEAELDDLVERRAQATKADEERKELWRASVDRYNAQRQEAIRRAWREYHLSQAARLEATASILAAEHRTQAAALSGSSGLRSKKGAPGP